VSPFWPLITGLFLTGGVEPIQVPLGEARNDDMQAALEAARTDRVRAIYFVTPNNPDGHVMTRPQLEQIAAFAQRHDLWVIADEVYADFVYDGAHLSIATLDGMFERTITSHSLSKSHGLAGARIGYVIAPERVIATTRRVSNHTLYNVPVAMQRAALAGVQNGEAWIADAAKQYRAARDATHRALSDVGIAAHVPSGGSFFFFDLAPHLNGHSLQELLERGIENGVLVAPGDAFGTHFSTWTRLCFTGVPLERTLEGVGRLAKALESLA
jgi:aspartate/methionine/tyrosine aminotransferase